MKKQYGEGAMTTPIVVFHGKAKQVWRAWDFLVRKLGSRTLKDVIRC